MTEPHYRLSETDTIVENGRDLRRVISTGKGSSSILRHEGWMGGYIESERNLVQGSCAWVDCTARVYDQAVIGENALITDYATIKGRARIHGNAVVGGKASISGDISISSTVFIHGGAVISEQVPIWQRTDGYYFILVKNKDGVYHVNAGCRYFTFDEAWKHWRNHSRKNYERKLYEETLTILKGFEAIAQRPLLERMRNRFR